MDSIQLLIRVLQPFRSREATALLERDSKELGTKRMGKGMVFSDLKCSHPHYDLSYN